MIHSALASLWRLVDDGLFWQYQSDGLALYGRPGWWRALRVSLDPRELAVVADRFHISPLLPLLASDGHVSCGPGRSPSPCSSTPRARRPGRTTNLLVPA
jgi:hypothetical protein